MAIQDNKLFSISQQVYVCPLCKCADRQLFSKPTFGSVHLYYWMCVRCGLVFQSPQMSKDEQDEFYANHYRKYMFGQADPPEIDLHIQSRRAEHLCKIIGKNCDDLRNHTHLDIGCGNGALVGKIQETFFCESYGIEPDNAYRMYALSQGITVFSSLEEWLIQGRPKVSLITMSHVLEHLGNPVCYLTDLREKVLMPSGFLLLEVPNLYFHQSFEVAHNYAFTLHTLSEVMQRAGYRLIFSKQHGVPLRKTPRYISVLAQSIENPVYRDVFPEYPGLYIKRSAGMFVSRLEDSAYRFLRRIKSRLRI